MPTPAERPPWGPKQHGSRMQFQPFLSAQAAASSSSRPCLSFNSCASTTFSSKSPARMTSFR
eukprot:1745332-Lingulodinium_polyedra.AAC.1